MGQETTLDLHFVLLSFLKQDLLHDNIVHQSPLWNICVVWVLRPLQPWVQVTVES